MAGQGFDPDFIFTWPTGRMGVMEGESAVQAVHGPALAAARAAKRPVSADVETAVDAMRAEYETQLDARYAAARGFVDAIIYPEETREVLGDRAPDSRMQSRAAYRGICAPQWPDG